MIRAHQLNEIGIPNHQEVIPLALKLVNIQLAQGGEESELLAQCHLLACKPQSFLSDPLWRELAHAIFAAFPEGVQFIPRSTPAPWKQWGDINLEESALRQMRHAVSLPNAVRGALMPDAHTGYGLPIGGVLAVRDAVIPYAVGVDIACRMRLTVLDMPVSTLQTKRAALIQALEKETRFGMGASFASEERRNHAVMDRDWESNPVTRHLKDKAWKQLGTSGGGNHFVEFGELVLRSPALGMEPGIYLALLSHSGSRGTGESIAAHYSKLAMSLRPWLPRELQHLAWLDMKSEAGWEYWQAMQLMGFYASANHELIHTCILRSLGAESISSVENHHNFAWKEEYDGEEVIVHRKGATPASKGILGIVPGSMGAPGFVVSGKGNKQALNSCSHGAGRLLSRTAAKQKFNRAEVQAYLEKKKVELLSGGLDEAPMAYKDIHKVMEAQSDLVDILARFEPRLVKMAPEERRGRKRKSRRK